MVVVVVGDQDQVVRLFALVIMDLAVRVDIDDFALDAEP